MTTLANTLISNGGKRESSGAYVEADALRDNPAIVAAILRGDYGSDAVNLSLETDVASVAIQVLNDRESFVGIWCDDPALTLAISDLIKDWRS